MTAGERSAGERLAGDSGAGAAGAGTVLVTGVSRYLGARVVGRLAADPRIGRVIGVDRHQPPADLLATSLGDDSARGKSVQFIQTDLTIPGIAGLIGQHGIDTVVHLAVAPRHRGAPELTSRTTPDEAGDRAIAKEQNVIGTIQLLAACQQEPGLRKVVIRSSTAAYGASFRDPAVFTEDTEPGERPRGGFARDVLDIEGYVRGFCRRRPDVVATVLRFAPFLGRGASTTLARYFALPVVPTVLGRDPRLQFIHADDAVEILHRAVLEDHPGTFNAAGAGVITLSQAVRRAGRIPLPLPEHGLSWAAGLARGSIDFSLDQLDLLVHGRVVDTAVLVDEFGYTPRTTAEAFDDFLLGSGTGPVTRDAVSAAERAVRDGVRQARAAAGGGR